MLISEIGLNHFGDIDKAKELIRLSHENGADLVKSQAYLAEDIKTGSMPESFYSMCQFKFYECLELLDYAESLGTKMFFSIFSESYNDLILYQDYIKVSAGQTEANSAPFIFKDKPNVFISFKKNHLPMPMFKRAQIMYATDYMTTCPELWHIDVISAKLNRPVGLSDHSIGIKSCIDSIKYCGVELIEKHFTLERDLKYNGQVFRDSVHAADPGQLAKIARALNDRSTVFGL